MSNSRFSLEERKLIVAEYLTGELRPKELCLKYGIITPSVLPMWAKRMGLSKKSVTLPRVKAPVTMEYKSSPETSIMAKFPKNPEEEVNQVRKELLEMRRALDWEKKRNLALETLIEVAEEHGMPVKKCGAKQ